MQRVQRWAAETALCPENSNIRHNIANKKIGLQVASKFLMTAQWDMREELGPQGNKISQQYCLIRGNSTCVIYPEPTEFIRSS